MSEESVFQSPKFIPVIKALTSRAQIFAMIGRNAEAFIDIDRALALASETGDKHSQGMAYNNLGYAYYVQGEYEKAIEYYFTYLKISEESGNSTGKALALNNIGSVFLQINNYEKAESYLNTAKQLFEIIDDRYTLIETHLLLAELYIKKSGVNPAEQMRQAFRHIRIAYLLAHKLGSKYRIACCHLTSARAYQTIDSYRKSAINYEKAIRQFESIRQKRELIDAYSEYAKLISILPAHLQCRNLSLKQKEYLSRAKNLCRKMKLPILARKIDIMFKTN